MTKEELKKEAQEQVNYCTPLYPESFIQGYLAGAEPRENQIADIKANCDLAIEGRDIKIQELEKNLKLWTDTKDARETIFFQQKRKIAELEKENHLLGERCNQLLKDKGELTDKIADIKANCDFAIEGRDVKIKELEQQIEKMKRHCNCKHRDSEGYCEVKRTYLMDLSYDGCDKWELED